MKKGSVRKALGRKPQPSAPQAPSPLSPAQTGTTSPSPPGQQTSPAAPKTKEQRHQQLDVMAGNAEAAFTFHKGGKGSTPGVRYITEPLIKDLSKQQNLAYITSLSLSSPKDGDKKYKYIENLDKCSKLEILDLSNNQIEKIEKLDKLLKLRELNLSCNRISKIEGIEHMQSLQKLNLAGNEIEHIPVWVGKKLRSLRILNLKQNKLSSLQDIAKLKPLQDLTSLFLADNPVGNLPHYYLYTIFHLRALENLDGQPVTNHDRQEALERFNLEEVEKLENKLENTVKELENLKLSQSKVLEQLQHQDEVNKSLKEKTLKQKQSYEDLQRDLGIKNELLKQKTVELTRAYQKQYELEQELAFYKTDAKFEPLNYFPLEEVELADVPGESPYIGKARYKRNMFIREGYIADKAQQMKVGKMPLDEHDSCRKPQLELHRQAPDELLKSKEEKINAAQRRLEELQSEIGDAEQQVLKVTEQLRQLEEVLAQKKISQANREAIEQQLSEKTQILQQLHKETAELERQIEKQKREIGENQKKLEELESSLASVNPEEPRHAHMKAQKASKEQQLDVMSKHCQELESRRDEMLSRIAKETEEIKDLEQQLTDGQIATNEALKRDLESIIFGLQDYLQSVKCQAKQANEECKKLQKDKESLLERLADLEEEKTNLEMVAMDAENMRKEIAMLENALQEQREANESLRDAQGTVSAYEAQLRQRDAEAKQQKEEFERLKQLSQMELSALQAELEKERQVLENAQSKAQLAEEKEQQNAELLSQVKQLQGDNNLLKQQLKDLQNRMNQAVGDLIHAEEVLAHINELKQKLQTGAGEIKCQNSADVLGKSLAKPQKEFNAILADAQREKEKACAKQRQLQEEMVSQQEKLGEIQEKYRQVKAENRQNKNKVHQLENEIQHLHEKLKSMEKIQGLADQQLQEADEEKEAVLAQLEDLEKRKKIEDARAQLQVVSLDKELKELQRAIITSDKLAATELSIAKDQLRAPQGTVLRINQERAEEIKGVLEELSIERKELDVQMSEKRAQLSCLKKDIGKEEENLQAILGQVTKHKMELKHVVEMLELERNELQGLKLQHDQRVNELGKIQVAILEEKLKLENIQRLFQCQQGEVDWQEQLLEKDRQENEHLVTQMHSLHSHIEALTQGKGELEETCQGLEKKLAQTRRDLTAAEESSRTALVNREKMELDVKNLQQEVELLNKEKNSLSGEIVAVQEDLQGRKEELERLKGELSDSRQQLQAVEQDLKSSRRQQEELLGEQAGLREEIREHLRKRKDCQERQKKRENQLQQLQRKTEEKETELAQQEMVLHRLQQNSAREGKKLEECTAKVKDQKILLEKELTDQQKKLEQTIAKVRLAEENLGKLEEEESRCAALEETVRKSNHQLLEKELRLQEKIREIQCLQKELEVSKSELKQLQDQIVSERREAENQILSLKETQKMQRMELERKLQANTQDLEERQREMESAATLLNLEVEHEIRTGFKSPSSSSLDPLEDVEAPCEGKRSLQCESDSSDTNPFAADRRLLSLEDKLNISRVFLTDEQWRGEALREKLQQDVDRLKAQHWRRLEQHAEVLHREKRQTAENLHNLQRQLDQLEDLLNTTASELLAKSSPSLASLHSAPNLTRAQAPVPSLTEVPSRPGGMSGSPVPSCSQGMSQ